MANNSIYIAKALLKSQAFRRLNGTAKTVLFDFMMKRKVQKQKQHVKAYKRESGWVIINNGQIEYTYSEAEKKGIPRSTFMRALDDLINHGFIDVAHSGSGGTRGDKSLYAISDRWQDWGTDKFEEVSRPKDTRQGRGFAVFWKKKRKNTSIKNDNATITKSDNPKNLTGLMEYQN